jgi:hypothetical protein
MTAILDLGDPEVFQRDRDQRALVARHAIAHDALALAQQRIKWLAGKVGRLPQKSHSRENAIRELLDLRQLTALVEQAIAGTAVRPPVGRTGVKSIDRLIVVLERMEAIAQ